MVSDPSALLLLNCGIPCLKASGTYQILKISRLKLAHGAEGPAHARFVQTVKFCSLVCLFNVLRTPLSKIYNSYDVLRFYGLFI